MNPNRDDPNYGDELRGSCPACGCDEECFLMEDDGDVVCKCGEMIQEGEGLTECGYWRLDGRLGAKMGHKCGKCDTCCDEGDRQYMAWKEGE